MFSRTDRVATKIRKFIESQLPNINDGIIDFISGFIRLSIDDIYISMEFNDDQVEINTNYKNYGNLKLDIKPKVVINTTFKSIPIDVMSKFIPNLAREYFTEVSRYEIENLDTGTIILTRSKYTKYKYEKIKNLYSRFSFRLKKTYNLPFPWVQLTGTLEEYELKELDNYLDSMVSLKYSLKKEPVWEETFKVTLIFY